MKESSPSAPRQSSESRLLLFLVLAGIVLVLLFGLRAAHAIRQVRRMHLAPGQPPDVQMIRGWMSIEYLAHVYQIPPDVLLTEMGLPAEPGNVHKSLSELNRQYYPHQRNHLVELARAIIQVYGLPSALPPLPTSPLP